MIQYKVRMVAGLWVVILPKKCTR